jgi:hypothetical protein
LLAVPATAALKIIISHVWRTHILGQPIAELVAAQEAADARGEGFVAKVGDDQGEVAPGPAHRGAEPVEVEETVEETETETEIELEVEESGDGQPPVAAGRPRPGVSDLAPGTRVVREP